MPAKKAPSTAVATKRESLPVDVQALLEKQKNAVMDKIGRPTSTVIQIKQNKNFVLPNGEITEGPIDLVILDFVSMNTFYEGAYDKDNIASPVCFAIGDNPDALIPSVNAPEVQADTCAVCPMNKYESAERGKGKACKNMRVLAVMAADASDEDKIWLLRVSPTGLKAYDAYVRNLAQRNNVAPIQVVTKVGFDPNSDYPSLRFAPERVLIGDSLAFFLSRVEEAGELVRTEPDYSHAEEEKKPAKKAPARKPAARR
jgi:hypothetical protein